MVIQVEPVKIFHIKTFMPGIVQIGQVYYLIHGGAPVGHL